MDECGRCQPRQVHQSGEQTHHGPETHISFARCGEVDSESGGLVKTSPDTGLIDWPNVAAKGKRMSRYVAIVDGVPGAYGVSFPDAPGCTAMGDTVDDAIKAAGAALAEWSADVLADGGTLLSPRTIEELRHDEDVLAIFAEGPALFAVVPLVINSGKPARANISLDTGLLQAIDDAADRLGLTRSAFLATAAREKIETTY